MQHALLLAAVRIPTALTIDLYSVALGGLLKGVATHRMCLKFHMKHYISKVVDTACNTKLSHMAKLYLYPFLGSFSKEVLY